MQRHTGTLRTHGRVGHTGLAGLAGLVGLVGLGALAAGCAASGGDESILVLKNVAPPITAIGGVCTFTASETEASVVHGVLDTSAGAGYQFTAQLKSRITADVGQEDQRTIFVRGANVDLTLGDASLLSPTDLAGLVHFMAPFSVPLAPNGGLADASFELIPHELATLLDGKPGFTSTVIEATFTVVGDLAGGNVSSQVFHYSVTLGHGLVIRNLGSCAALPSTFLAHTGNACYFGQDILLDCCSQGSTAVCPAVGTGM